MLVQCPSCRTTYRVGDNVVAIPNPTFRCSRCKHMFVPARKANLGSAHESRTTMAASRRQEDEENRELSFLFCPPRKEMKRREIASPQVAHEPETVLEQPQSPVEKKETPIAESPRQEHSVSVLPYLSLFFCLLLFLFGSSLTFINQPSARVPSDSLSTEGMNLEAEQPKNNPFSPLISLPQKEYSSFEELEGLSQETLRSKPEDSRAERFSRIGITGKETQIHSIEKSSSTKRVLPGKEKNSHFTKPPSALTEQQAAKHLKALEIERNENKVPTWEKGNKIIFRKRGQPDDMELKSAAAVVENSPSESGQGPALHPALLSQLADIFNWEVDFDKNLQNGDTFKLLYEERTRKSGQKKTSFHILAAELMNAGQKLFAIYFEKENGKGKYYDLDGRSLARAFLRFPLEFSSISSHFSHSRFNPILKIDAPHNGVDFAAKPGTPVRAIGDGKISYAGWKNGGYGRMVEIHHDSRYVTRYAHLQNLAPKIREGAPVQKGQIIGYVGSSGRTTGAHLHFELYEDQKYVDPLIFEIPPEDKIEPALQRMFENAKQLLLARLAATPAS